MVYLCKYDLSLVIVKYIDWIIDTIYVTHHQLSMHDVTVYIEYRTYIYTMILPYYMSDNINIIISLYRLFQS